MSIKLRSLGTACFEIVLPSGKVLVTDPYIDDSPTAPLKSQDVTGADYIAITHSHFDHITDVGKLVKRFNSTVICSHQLGGPLASYFGFDLDNLIKVRAGDTLVFDDLRVEVKRTEHITEASLRKMHPRPPAGAPGPSEGRSQGSGPRIVEELKAAGIEHGFVNLEMINFVFQAADNLRIHLFGGGTYGFQRHEIAQARGNVAIVQLAGNEPEAIAELAALSGAELIIPFHHWGTAEAAKVPEMARHLAARSKAQLLDVVPGKWYEIGIGANELG